MVEGYEVLPAVLTVLNARTGAPVTDATFTYPPSDGYGDAQVPEEENGHASEGTDGVYYIENLPEAGVGYYYDPYGSTFDLLVSAPGYVQQLLTNVTAGTTGISCGVAYNFAPTVATVELVPAADAGCAEAGACSTSESTTHSSAGSTSEDTGATTSSGATTGSTS